MQRSCMEGMLRESPGEIRCLSMHRTTLCYPTRHFQIRDRVRRPACGYHRSCRIWRNQPLSMRSGRSRIVLAYVFVLFAALLFPLSNAQSITSHVVINEFEQNPPGDERVTGGEFVELFNPTDSAVDIGGWSLATTHGKICSYTIPVGTTMDKGPSWWAVDLPGQYIDNEDPDSLILCDKSGGEVDRTPAKTDTFNDDRSWQRFPDSSTDWVFAARSTFGTANIPEFPIGALVLIVSMIAASLLLRFVKRARNLESSDHTTRDHTST